MAADIDKDDLLVRDDQLQGDPVTYVDADRVKALQLARKGMQSQSRMVGIDFEEFEGFLVLAEEVRVAFEKFPGATEIALRIDKLIPLHSA